MALDFAVLGLPRSGTTWAANWLTSGEVICHHDPLETTQPEALFDLDGGIACTGLWLRPDLVARLSCPIVCLWRDPRQVNESLLRIGLGEMPAWSVEQFRSTPGHWFAYEDLFTDRAREIWSVLRDDPFDADRHAALVRLNVQPLKFAPDRTILKEFLRG